MTLNARKIAELQGLTALTLRVVQAELQQLKAKETRLRQHLAALTVQKYQQTHAPRTVDDPALVAGADLRWQHWADQRRGLINMELARVLALIDSCQHRLRQAFGRDLVAGALCDQAVSERKNRAMRATAYES